MSDKKPVKFPPLLADDEIDEFVVRKSAPPQPPRPSPLEVVAAGYPRIAERIAKLWGTAECDRYLAELLIDSRGNRQGFPPPVVSALLALSEQHQGRGAPPSGIEHPDDADRRGGR
jgi:hypothetical protein